MLIDLHMHTSVSSLCSRLDPDELVRIAVERGLDGVCITDHVYSLMRLEPDYEAAMEGYRTVKESAAGTPLLVFPGLEITCDEGDFLVMGLDREGLLRGGDISTLRELASLVHESDGVIIWAHPLRNQIGFCPSFELAWLDGMEVLNGSDSAQRNEIAEQVAAQHGILGLAGSDAHSPSEVGAAATRFARDVGNLTGLCAAIRERQVAELYRWQDGAYAGKVR